MITNVLFAMTALQTIMDPIPAESPDEPLRQGSAYSLEIDENGNGTDGFYPLGVLGDRPATGFGPFIGGNYSVARMTPDSAFPVSRQGVFGVSVPACQNAWLDKTLPKALGSDGEPLKRRPVNLFDAATLDKIFSFARETVSNAVAQADGRIFKWEIDNEFIPELDFSPQALAAFREWLPGWYGGDVEKFRRVWGDGFRDFADAVGIDPDKCRERPGPFMDWLRFQQETFADFLAAYCRAIAEADPRHRPVNGKDTQSSLEMLRIARARRANHELIGERIAPWTHGVRGMDHYGHGDRNAYEMNFYAQTASPGGWKPGRRAGILYGENNNHNGPGWQWAQTLWRMPPNGLKGGNLFCSGWFGAWGDWAGFGFVNPDGSKREKFWYLPRFFAAIHRAERFFAEAAPAPGQRKLAILMAQRDIPFGADDNISPWTFPVNSRLRLYSHLRDAGHFVDVIPYSRLAPETAREYDAVFLVAAERLSDGDIANLRAYVDGGGVLVCDCRAGQFDEHGLPRDADGGLADVLGLRFDGVWESSDVVVDPGDVWFDTRYGRLLRGDGRVKFTATTARPWNARSAFFYDNKAAVLMENRFGKGRAYWTNTQLGTLRSESSDGEEPARDFFRTVLDSAGCPPSYRFSPERGCEARVEPPLVDGRGNAVVMVAARTWRGMEPSALSLRFPESCTATHAFIGLAEENSLAPLPMRRGDGGEVVFDLPAIRSAAAIWLMGDHAPLLGTRFAPGLPAVAPGETTPAPKPGESFEVAVQVANPGASPLAGAEVRLRALRGWTVERVAPLGDVAPGAIGEALFRVTVPAEGFDIRPDHVQPIVADLFAGGRRVAVTHAVVQVDVPKEGHELLLSDNWVSADCHWSRWTGASYRYLTEPDPAKGERIEDTLHTRRADGSDVHALQSGDRADRPRFAFWKGMHEVSLEWDLKAPFDVSRVLVKRGKGGAKADPLSFACSFSEDGRTWTEPERFGFAPDEKGFVLAEPARRRRARFVRFDFALNPKRRSSMDGIWIFGYDPPRPAQETP